jgi:hypothetical protein
LTSLYNDLENPKGTKVEGREGKRERIREREREKIPISKHWFHTSALSPASFRAQGHYCHL